MEWIKIEPGCRMPELVTKCFPDSDHEYWESNEAIVWAVAADVSFGAGIYLAAFAKNFWGRGEDVWEVWDGEETFRVKPTHWMPLPDPPVAESEGEPTAHENFIHDKYGYCYYVIEPGKSPLIFGLYTEPQYKRQGHARKKLEYVINEIRKSGYIGEIEIEASPNVDVDRKQLIEFYKRLGLKVINEHTFTPAEKGV